MASKEGGTTSPALLNRLVDWRDDGAWNEFVERYRPLIEGWCRRMRLDGETTEELCQRLWIELARRMSNFQYDPSRKFRGWLRRLCHSRAVDLLRERQSRAMRLLDEEPAHPRSRHSDVVDEGEEKEAASAFPQLVQLGRQVHDSVKGQVEPRTWRAFWSIAVEQNSVRETAANLKMSYAAAFAAHKRVAARLRREGRRVLAERSQSKPGTGTVDER
jgi:RNA polymerase sigma factor (sigma-70 family)